jgi:hypothetical protein
MQTIMVGKTLGAGDLSLLIRDQSGALIDPTSISYSIFQTSSKSPVHVATPYTEEEFRPEYFNLEGAALVTQPKMQPARSSQGAFYVPITIPTTWQGQYRLVWYIVNFPGGAENQRHEEFLVQYIDPMGSSFDAPSVLIAQGKVTTNKYAPAIMSVRELLGDENPDRNYHFRPPTPGKVVAGFNTRVGFIWTDKTIIRMLGMAISKLNTCNIKNYTNFTLDTVPITWADCASIGAAAHCLNKQASTWISEEFNYSLNGVSLDIHKAAEYQSLAASFMQEFNEWAPLLTACRPGSVGLRQSRWLI